MWLQPVMRALLLVLPARQECGVSCPSLLWGGWHSWLHSQDGESLVGARLC